MTTKEITNLLSGSTAEDILLAKVPDAESRLEKAAKILENLLADVRKHFPEAWYYSECSELHLMLAKCSDREGSDQRASAVSHQFGGCWDSGAW